jgi:hypothetical protein
MICVVWTEKKKQVQKSINVVTAKGCSPATSDLAAHRRPNLSATLTRTRTAPTGEWFYPSHIG